MQQNKKNVCKAVSAHVCILRFYSNVEGGKGTFPLMPILKATKITLRRVNKKMYNLSDKRFSVSEIIMDVFR